MGQKSNPIILRLNKTNQHWNSCWYSDDDYATPFLQDCKINAYIKSSQQQLERFPPVSFIKRQRGDLQIVLFSAKVAQQFSKFKGSKYKNVAQRINGLMTHNIFKRSANPVSSKALEWSASLNRVQRPVNNYPTYNDLGANASSTGWIRKREYFTSQLFLAIISRGDVVKAALNNMPETKAALCLLSRKIPPLAVFFSKEMVPSTNPWSIIKEESKAKIALTAARGTANLTTANKTTPIRVADPTKNHLEYSIYKYYNEYSTPFASAKSKLYLVKSSSIYQNPLFLASQVVSLLEERAVFRQIKHRIVREIRKNPIIKGVRIICSGRVASRSKKAQKARRESILWGATSLNVFSEHVNFASCFAQTTFGKIGVKVWVSYGFTSKVTPYSSGVSKIR